MKVFHCQTDQMKNLKKWGLLPRAVRKALIVFQENFFDRLVIKNN